MRFLSLVLLAAFASLANAAKPNVVVILADDLGTGDVKCLNSKGKIPTPHLDRLAAAGMIFTDAHSPSAVCTPTRYGLLTGRYAWRTKLQSGVLGGLSPRLIEPGRETVASLLKSAGYHTGCVGKWHVGMDWERKPGKAVTELNIEPRAQVFNVEYTKPIKNGPNAVGFDYYFGISASLDMVPYAFIENDRVTADPTEDRSLAMRPDKPATTRPGPAAPGFTAEAVLPRCTEAAVAFLERRAKEKATPFFLYLPLTAPHTPIAPAKEWANKSGVGPYGDFVMQTDAAVGAVMAALETHGFAENTLVIFTSDNGCSPQADFPDLAKRGHNPSHVYRGHKADLFEGGHRVPFLARWPGTVKPGTTSDRLVCLTDVLRTVAGAAGIAVPETAGEDSASFLPTLKGEAQPARSAVVHHSINGSFAVREGDWKLLLCGDSGGWSAPRPGATGNGTLPAVQLYNLKDDIGETENRHATEPATVARLTGVLEGIVAKGRNAVPVAIRKKK